jgi:glycosyltransferase involved in cell wall biosynthesis
MGAPKKLLKRERYNSMKYRVLHLIGSNLVGGPEKQILHHAEAMRGSEYEIEIGSFHDLSEWPEVLSAAAQKNIGTVCLKGGFHPGLISELATVLRERRGGILCTHGFKSNVIGYLAARRTGTPHVAFLRGFTAENPRVAFYELLERQALKRAPWVVCVSQKQAEQIGKLRGHRGQPVVVPNVMLPPYAREHDGPVTTKKSLRLPEDAFVFGSVGRLSIEKGHRFLISAFHELCTMVEPDFPISLIVIGDGREQIRLEEQASRLGIRDKVLFAGFQGNCGEWMRLFDCLVQPSLTEGTPNSVLEAICLRVPVVATAVGGVPDLISDGRSGLLVPKGDPHAMAVAMKKMIDLPDLRRRVVAGGVDVREKHSPQRQKKKLMEVYGRALNRGQLVQSR